MKKPGEARGHCGFWAAKNHNVPNGPTGSVLYVLTVPKERIERDGMPRDEFNPKLNNLKADADLLQDMGIKEEWLDLPNGIDTPRSFSSKTLIPARSWDVMSALLSQMCKTRFLYL
jgi:hypothetical protein